MVFQMQKQLDDVFQRCSEGTLDNKTTGLVRFAAQLACGHTIGAVESYNALTRSGGASEAEVSLAACLAACTSGPRATIMFTGVSGKTKTPQEDLFKVCTNQSLDARTYHLVALAACLATNCACASGHLVRLKEMGVDESSVHRAACITAEEAGVAVKYSYLEHSEFVRTCTVGCVCA